MSMQAMIDEASKGRDTGRKDIYGKSIKYHDAAVDLPAGRLFCRIVRKEGRIIQGRILRPQVIWTLDGKRIKAADVEALF